MKAYMKDLPSPCYVVEEGLLRKNLEILARVKKEGGCKILLAQKAFSMFSMYPQIASYLDGTTASGIYEARLGFEEFGGETHIFSSGYQEKDFDEILQYSKHLVFNSKSQFARFGMRAIQAGASVGVRINPGCSTQEGHEIYDPCAPFSRLGVTKEQFSLEDFQGIEGLHFHTLCEQNVDALVETLEVFERDFGTYLHQLKWLNLGGGHHITRDDYDVDTLIATVKRLRETYDVEVYMEPGEAVVLNTGFLVTTVLDKLENGMELLITDASAACHMPDVIEMPYRPLILGSAKAGEKTYTYRLGGPTCLAGDIIGDYSFDQPVEIGDRLAFCDMALYTMVKNNTFNGMPLPSIAIHKEDGSNQVVKTFGYEDFKMRLS